MLAFFILSSWAYSVIVLDCSIYGKVL